jgi:hypothetical protein
MATMGKAIVIDFQNFDDHVGATKILKRLLVENLY